MMPPVQDLEVAKQILTHLGSPILPTVLYDDEKKRFDSTTRSEDEKILAHFKEDSLHSLKTVRFLKDFYNYKAAPDLETTNESFLRTSELFRLQGNKNYYFMLQLNNPLLKGVDPFSEDLTNEQKTMIYEECKSNFWYFLREVCKLKPTIKFKANRGNISFIWSYLNHITSYMIMPRQQGKMQEEGTKILTAKGDWRKIEQLNIGDEIATVDGETSRVIGIHPQGVKRLYKLMTSDGRALNTGTKHLWTVFDKRRGRTGGVVDYSTAQLSALMAEKEYYPKSLSLPLVHPTEFKEQTLLDSYFYGYFLGAMDSSSTVMKEDGLTVEQLLPHTPDCFTVKQHGKYLYIANKTVSANYQDVGLPTNYTKASIEQRLDLVQGFMDANGSVTDGKVFLSIPNAKLRVNMQYVVRSLGGTAKEENEGLFITLPEDMDYFKYKTVDVPEQDNTLYIEKIEYCRHNTAYCIEVDSQDQLYVTDDFIVTHNTVSVQVINFWLTYIVGRGYKAHIITLKSENRAQFIEAVKSIRSCIPQYLVNPTYRDKDAGTYLTYRSFGDAETNVMTISVPQQGEAAAGDLGRGLTVGTTTIDEPSYIKWIDAIVDGCAPSALTEMENCRDAGLPYGINFITTPNTVLHPSGEYMYDKVMNSTEWREKFFDSFSESHLIDRLIKASPRSTTSPSVSMVYNYMQLGKGPDWVKKTIDQLGLSLSRAKIDLLLMWVEDGEDKLFDDRTRVGISEAKRNVLWSKEYKRSGLFLDMFVPKEEFLRMCSPSYNDFILVGCDTSSAINSDACTVVMRSFRTGKVVGVGRYPLAFLDDVGGVLVDVLSTIPNSMLVIERNYAHHMIDSLLISLNSLGLDPFQKLFNQIYQDPVRYAKEIDEIKRTKPQYRDKDFYLKYKKHFGFNTNASSRATMYGYIQEAVAVTGYGLHYDKLCDELINLRVKGGRIDHDVNKHDDLVIAWLLTYWFIKLGASKSMYNIPAGLALIETKNLLASVDGEAYGKIDPELIAFIDKVRDKIRQLTEELMETNDNILAARLEAEIIKLGRLIPEDTNRSTITVDSILEDAKLARNKRIMQRKKVA